MRHPALVSAATLPATSTVGKRHGATLAPVSRLSPLVIRSRTSETAAHHSGLPTPVVYCASRKSRTELLSEVPMFSKSCLALVLGLAAALAPQAIPQAPAPTQTTIPDTPAGRTFKAWLEAFNSGDRALLDAYLHKYDPSKSLDIEMQFRGMTGGFDLLQIVKNGPPHLQILVHEHRNDTNALCHFL